MGHSWGKIGTQINDKSEEVASQLISESPMQICGDHITLFVTLLPHLTLSDFFLSLIYENI